MDFQSAMETFAEAWVAANTQTPLTEAAEAQGLLLGQAAMGGGLPVGPPCLHDLAADRREKQEGSSDPGRSSLRSPGSSHSAALLGDFRAALKVPNSPSGRLIKPDFHSHLYPLCDVEKDVGSRTEGGKAIPVHCVVEQVANPQGCPQPTEAAPPTVELDNYAIIPSGALFSDLVRTALIKLGYSASEAAAAKGAIQIKNWKPLMLDQITESPEATVGDILGELATVATLRIRLYSRPKMNAAHDVKEKLLQVLLAQSQSLLVSSGCPIDQSILAALTKGRLECDIPDETRKKFDQWYLQQVFQHCRQVALLQQQHHIHHHQQQQQPPQVEQQPPTSSPSQHTVSQELSQRPASSQHSQGRTRIRTSFDPELELPKLHRWFAENQHPSRLQIQQYVKELNSLESRRGRKPLDVNNVVYWFKNARAAHKRAEQKCCTETNGIQSPCSELPGESVHLRNASIEHGCMGERIHVSRSDSLECRAPEGEMGRFSVGDSHSESQANSSDDSDNVHTLDLSIRRERCQNGAIEGFQSPHTSPNELRIKEEPRDSCSDHSLESSDSGDEEVDVMEDVTMISEEQETRPDCALRQDISGNTLTQNGGITEDCSVSHQQGDLDHQMSPFSGNPMGHLEERRKRNRTFIDPVTEVPRLEQWFSANTHPAHSQIVRYTQELNSMPYRQKFPKLEPKNIQFWFKNRRAKCKRLNLAALQSTVSCTDKLVLSAN